MKFAICTNKPAAKPTAVAKPQVAPITPEDITEAYEGMMAAYMELTDAQRNLDEVCQVMENINLSMQILQSGSADAVKLLNIDKSLENLLGIAEEKIAVQTAEEGLGQAAVDIWKKFWEWIKKIAASIRNFFSSVFNFRKKKEADVQKVANSSDEAILKAIEAISKVNATGRKINVSLDMIKSDMENLGKTIERAAVKEGDIEKLGEEISKLSFRLSKAANEWYAEMASFLKNPPKDVTVIAVVQELNNKYNDQFSLIEEGCKLLRTKLNDRKVFDDLDNDLNKLNNIINGNESLSSQVSLEDNQVTINMFSGAAKAVKHRCSQSSMKKTNANLDQFNKDIVKFHADLEISFSNMKDHPEISRQIASQIKKFEDLIRQISTLDVTILKQSTYVTSKIAGKL